MDFDAYQVRARDTDTLPTTGDEKLHFLVLGLSDEVGQIAGLAKKSIRHKISPANQATDYGSRLGDALWYLSAIADHVGVKLSSVASGNLQFLERRWTQPQDSFFSSRREFHSDDNERLPDRLDFKFERREGDGFARMCLSTEIHGQVGDVVDDNEYKEDHYRFHDVIHIAMMACFRWSPVFRRLLSKKRKSNPDADRVGDGAKARDIEEALSRFIYVYLERNDFLRNATSVDTNFLRLLGPFAGEREVSWVTEQQWEDMMMQSASVIRSMIHAREGVLAADIANGRISFKQSAST